MYICMYVCMYVYIYVCVCLCVFYYLFTICIQILAHKPGIRWLAQIGLYI